MQQENSDSDDDDDDGRYNGIYGLIIEELIGVGLDDLQIEILLNDNWYQQSRTHAVAYILNTWQEFEFSIQTVYTAVMYVDRILANRILRNGLAVRILAVACLSLSAELNEIMDDVPQLSEYLTIGSYNINVNVIRRMRRLVRNEFDGDMNIVTPFAFINFFISRFCRLMSRREITRIRTGEIFMSVVTEVTIMISYRPSVIAEAVTLLAVSRYFTVQDLDREIDALPIQLLDNENVYYLYHCLRNLN